MTSGAPSGDDEGRGIRERLSSGAEDTIGKLADDLLENSLVNSALQRAFDARDKVAQAHESAMGALNLPSASNIERLERRLRSISQRLEALEDTVERIDNRVEGVLETMREQHAAAEQLRALNQHVDERGRDVGALRRELAPTDAVPAAQTRAAVEG
jgi:predicted RNase H-like nuclease (RuvC/YqgF family)